MQTSPPDPVASGRPGQRVSAAGARRTLDAPPDGSVALGASDVGKARARPSGTYAAALEREWLAIELRRLRAMRHDGALPTRLQSVERPPERQPERLSRQRVSAWFRSHLTGEMPTPDSAEDKQDEERAVPPPQLVGLALSGGGIRSATFSLGLLEGLRRNPLFGAAPDASPMLQRLGLLGLFDYVSTVSGGGFTGAWWSAFLAREGRRGDHLAFPEPERLEPDRRPPILIDRDNVRHGAPDPLPVEEGSRSVQARDPINHLRLFSNYLTPRKGALSADAWRAAAIATRNLALTWLVLVPLFAALILAVQVYFAVEGDIATDFACSRRVAASSVIAASADASARASDGRWSRETACVTASRSAPQPTASNAADDATRSRAHAVALRTRVMSALRPVLALVAWMIALTVVWMIYSANPVALALIGVSGLGVLAWSLVGAVRAVSGAGGAGGWTLLGPTWTLVAALLIGGTVLYGLWKFVQALELPSTVVWKDGVRNRLARYHGRALMSAVGITVALALAGFGHELAWASVGRDGWVTHRLAKAGGWGALLLSVATSLFTALKASPSAKDDDASASPGKWSALAFRLAPPLLLLTLGVLFAWFGHMLLMHGGSWAVARVVARALLIGAALETALAIGEMFVEPEGPGRSEWAVLASIGGATLLALAWWLLPQPRAFLLGVSGVQSARALVLVVLALVLARMLSTREDDYGRPSALRWRSGTPVAGDDRRASSAATVLIPTAITVVLLLLLVFGGGRILALFGMTSPLLASTSNAAGNDTTSLARIATAGVLFCGAMVVLDFLLSRTDRVRAMGLLLVAAMSFSVPLLLHFMPHDAAHAQVLFVWLLGCTALVLLAWVIGLGWSADPNVISLHNFYKARLVRAYLGASNPERRSEEITDSARGDDVRLSALWNHVVGAPHHLISTTLNLVGGRDLGTAQRSASHFVLSKYICGSARTGYRPTEDYMGGTLTLGAAAAISGAAVSPSMGSATPSAAVALLLALFNVRLGFWAPTPNKKRWNEAQARLWPFYLLRESLSQTNELGTYCYLTDGGHFDNTALYALVERGCQYILVADDGADPRATFNDIGQAVRRCRIDFGAEISELDWGTFAGSAAKGGDGLGGAHFVTGTVTYNDAHLLMLGIPSAEIDARRIGTIVWVKPVVTRTDTMDVHQYRRAYPDFPQQSTADQAYDEAQFESYRALGFLAATALIEKAGPESLPVAPEDAAAFFRTLSTERSQ